MLSRMKTHWLSSLRLKSSFELGLCLSGHGLRKIDLVENLHVVNDLIDMYSKSGDFDTARDLFGYNMSFHGNVIIGGYTQMSHY
ncbi:hypothetical protein SLE2022_159720 [Rubroshorea leprosula]